MKITPLLAVLIFAPAPAAADEDATSGLAVGRGLTFGLEVIRAFGTLPRSASGAEGASWSKTAVLLRLRSTIGESRPVTMLGSQLAGEYSLSAGYTEPELSVPGVEQPPLYLAGSFGPTLRVWTFDAPARGMLVVLLGAEAAIGGGHWWSNHPRFSPFAGARLAIGEPEEFSLELEYLLHPYAIGATFEDRRVIHTEHRADLRLSYGAVGVAIGFDLLDDLVTRGGTMFLQEARARGYAIGAALEVRR